MSPIGLRTLHIDYYLQDRLVKLKVLPCLIPSLRLEWDQVGGAYWFDWRQSLQQEHYKAVAQKREAVYSWLSLSIRKYSNLQIFTLLNLFWFILACLLITNWY